MAKAVITHEEFRTRLDEILRQIVASNIKIDVIIGLARGGFHLAAYLAQRLNISGQYVIGLPTYRDAGEYYISNLVNLHIPKGSTVLVADDATVRGILIQDVKRLLVAHGAGVVYTCAMIAGKEETKPDFVSEVTAIPYFYWEV